MTRQRQGTIWLGAIAIGVAYALWLMPLGAVRGSGAMWQAVTGDDAQSLSLHLAFQTDAWQLPPLFDSNLFWPHGVAVSMGDGNPLFSLVAKAIVTAVGGGPINLMGLWFALCWAAMPAACVYALRGLGVRSVAAFWAAGCLAMMMPALLGRFYHINLMGHFLIVLALGVSFRLLRQPRDRDWVVAFVVLLLAVLTHPYLYLLAAAVLCAPVLHGLIATRRMPWRQVGRSALAIVLPVAMLTAASGTLGGGDKGFGLYSMNLLSMIVPQRSGLFGPDLPVIDATGGQYEGFAYLGAGILFVLAVWLFTRPWRRAAPWRGMVVVLIGLAVLAIGSRVFAGQWKLLDLGFKPWEDIFAVFRAHGRAIWPVCYALMLAAVAGVALLPRRIAWPVLAVAVGLQWLDTAPLRHDAETFFAGRTRNPVALPVLPRGATLLGTYPAPGCTSSPIGMAANSPLLLEGARAGLRLSDIGLGRQPRWFNCEKFLSNGLESPMLTGEVRVFTDPQYWPELRMGVFGNAACADTQGMVICAAGTAGLEGTPHPLLGPDHVATLDAPATGAALLPFLGFGWKTDAQGSIWSEGPRAALVLRSTAPGDRTLVLDLTGISFSAGGTRDVTVSMNGTNLATAALADMQASQIAVTLPARLLVGGIAWIALDVQRPVDPVRRTIAAPVNRSALRLGRIGWAN